MCTDALLVVEAHDGHQCTFALAGRHAFCVIVWLEARAPAAPTNTPIHSRNQHFCVKFCVKCFLRYSLAQGTPTPPFIRATKISA